MARHRSGGSGLGSKPMRADRAGGLAIALAGRRRGSRIGDLHLHRLGRSPGIGWAAGLARRRRPPAGISAASWSASASPDSMAARNAWRRSSRAARWRVCDAHRGDVGFHLRDLALHPGDVAVHRVDRGEGGDGGPGQQNKGGQSGRHLHLRADREAAQALAVVQENVARLEEVAELARTGLRWPSERMSSSLSPLGPTGPVRSRLATA